jgi:hypothetical protein
MFTCNLSKIMHNVWLQHSSTTFREWGSCLHAMTAENYVQVFKHTTLYYLFKKGDPSGQGPNKSELLLRRMTIYMYISTMCWIVFFIKFCVCGLYSLNIHS